MKMVATAALTPGMVLGENVLVQGQVLCSAGTVLTGQIIEHLKYYAVMYVSVIDNADAAPTHFAQIRFDEGFRRFEAVYNNVLMRYKMAMYSFFQTGVQVPDDMLIQFYNEISATLSSGPILLDYLYNMIPNEDELTFTHCLSSALLAGVIGDWISMDNASKRILILCGFYYDIGKLQLPYAILWKAGKLTPEEFRLVQTHPIVGYNIVSRLMLNEHVRNAVIMHHERLDGSGYPYQLQGQQIDVFARYIAIIDAYIAMGSPRTYRNALTPLQILGNFEKDMSKFDFGLLLPLMKRIADAQIGTKVITNDNRLWEVLVINANKLSRPILKNAADELLDLAEHPEIEIVKMA
ncbi:MAG: HD domain-containing protein [Lachnospiraceae bacterium]|nr:HD domain-containing protein [Lachnospiraceae bacterium]